MVEEPGSAGEQTPEAETAALKGRIVELEQAVAGKETEIASLVQAKQETETKLAVANDTLSKAVSSYKSLVVSSNPEVVEELISGDTVESIVDSLSRAKAFVTKVRLGVQNEISRAKVPAGAPERSSPDLSALSPHEKIQYGIKK